MHRLAIFHLPKNGRLREKIGNHTGKIKKQNWFTIGKDNIVFIVHFPSDVESRRKLYFADNVPANET
jgi:hypothetical protein